MTAERPILTGEQVARAENRVGVAHPVLAVIDHHLPTITRLTEGYSKIANNQEQQRYIDRNYGFFADALVEASPYTMGPTDIIAIWSRASEVFSGYHRYALAGMVSSAYAVHGAENPEWRRFPRHYLETSKLPAGVERDREGLLHVKGRLDEIRVSLKAIDAYTYGTDESPMQLAADLAKRFRDGDVEAGRQLDELIARDKQVKTPVLGEIHENFGNGFVPLSFPIGDALRALEA